MTDVILSETNVILSEAKELKESNKNQNQYENNR